VARTETERRSTLVDANVLLDVLTADPTWGLWSRQALSESLVEGRVVISPIVFAEVAAGFDAAEDLEAFLPQPTFVREPIPWPAAFLAGRAHAVYRRRGGRRRATLPDFFIGAHAAVAGHRLLTRDPSRVRSSFPRLEIIAPS